MNMRGATGAKARAMKGYWIIRNLAAGEAGGGGRRGGNHRYKWAREDDLAREDATCGVRRAQTRR